MAANPKYIESAVKLFNLERKRGKAVPQHSLLSKVDESMELILSQQSVFRSGLGTVMYLAQEIDGISNFQQRALEVG